MDHLLKQLIDYFDNSPKEVIAADWERIHSQFGYGVDADMLFEDEIYTFSKQANQEIANIYGCDPQPFNTAA